MSEPVKYDPLVTAKKAAIELGLAAGAAALAVVGGWLASGDAALLLPPKYLIAAPLLAAAGRALLNWSKNRPQHARTSEPPPLPPTPEPIPAPKPRLARLIRMEKDVLKPGQVAALDGKLFRIVRLISSSATETVYEGVEA